MAPGRTGRPFNRTSVELKQKQHCVWLSVDCRTFNRTSVELKLLLYTSTS